MSVPAQLQRLADSIGIATGLDSVGMERGIRAALQQATTGERWLPPERRRANHERYARHLLYGDPAGRFSILSLVWDRGQMSPIHAHYCWCAVGVYSGLLTETYYRAAAGSEPPVETGSARHATGESTFDPGAGLHRLGNYSGVLAISLHVYGVAADRIATGVNRVYA